MNPGDILDGRYEILARLGAGGMGEVYKARHTFLGHARVIKVVHPQIARSDDARERFLREAQIATKIQHPNVATFHDFAALPDGSHYMVWEFIDGENLAQRLRARGTLPPRLAVRMAIEALRGLEAIHRAGIIHRDISPENLMITRAGAVKIIDLGVAKFEDPAAVSQTRTGIFVGKLRYAAPEQLGFLPDGEHIDARVDLWAMAMVLVEALTGRPPYEAKSPHEYYLHHAREMTQTNVELPPALPGARPLQAVLLKALLRDRNQRYASAAEFAAALEEIERTLPEPVAIPTLEVAPEGDDTLRQRVTRVSDPGAMTERLTGDEVVPQASPTEAVRTRPAIAAPAAAVPPSIEAAPPPPPPHVPVTPALSVPARRSRTGLVFGLAAALLLVVAGALAFRMQLTDFVFPRKEKPAAVKAASAAPRPRPAASAVTVTPPATIEETPATGTTAPAAAAETTATPATPAVATEPRAETPREVRPADPREEPREEEAEPEPVRVRRPAVYVAGLGDSPANERALERLRRELRGVTSISLLAGRHQVDVYRTIHRYLPDLEFDADSPVVVRFDTTRTALGRQLAPLGSSVIVEKNGEIVFRFEAGRRHGDAAESFAAVLAEAFQ